ncbi:PEP-CTERM sorting domain-containing protein [Dapis sp. BLCC M126]|uniref:PEP-CTERM sorting domain-containing protein n=1 Tax=Dapis sp. BLCC M126 TaxID=3400189 RepID=UPI003CFB2DEA
MIQKTLLIAVGLASLGVLNISESTLAASLTGKVGGSFDWEETSGGDRKGKATYEFDKQSGEGIIKGFPNSPAPIFLGKKVVTEDGETAIIFGFEDDPVSPFSFLGGSGEGLGMGQFPIGEPLPLETFTFIARNLTIAHVPEPTSALSFLALGTLGAASTLKHKLKRSKSADKELEKVS